MTTPSPAPPLDTPSLSVGVLAADLLRLGEALATLRQAGVPLVHVDVMDGVFCPPMTAGPGFVAAIAAAGWDVDVHLMVEEPLEKVAAYVEAGARILTFQLESTRYPHRVLQSLAGSGVMRGVALAPGTPVSAVEPLLDDLELVLLLAVNPGWPGQSFLPRTPARLLALRELTAPHGTALGIDGGVTLDNVQSIAALGADLIVAGTAVFAVGDATDNARSMLEATRCARHRQSPSLQPALGASEERFDG